MSDNRIPSPGDESPFSPPPPPAPGAPAGAPALPAQPMPPAVQPQATQSYPGAAPAYAPPARPVYGMQPSAVPQPGYAPPPSAPGYGAAPVQSGYASAYPAPRPTSPLAVTSLVCGIAGVVLFWAVIPLLASIAAIITGHMALGQTKRDPGLGGRGMAIAGLILGYVVIGIGAFILISTIISFVFLGAFSLPFMFSS